jgi:hypothetical protein
MVLRTFAQIAFSNFFYPQNDTQNDASLERLLRKGSL